MTTTFRSVLALTALALALPGAARAATVTVSPGDNVQAKLDAAADGDTVHFKPGTYTGTFTAAKNTLTVEGEGGVFLTNPSGATAPTLTFTGTNAKLTDITILSTVADAVVLGKEGSTIQRSEIVATKSGQSAVSVVGAGLDAARTITIDSSVLSGPKSFSASYAAPGIGLSTITANFRHVTAIGNVVADASAGVGLGGGIAETFLDSIIRGARVVAAGAPTTATITADAARNSVADTAADAAALFALPTSFNYHLRADASAVIDKGQVTAGESDKDIDGEGRTAGPASDYGADEFVNKAPTAALAGPKAEVRQNIAAVFDASKSADPEAASGGGIAAYHWDFGDGTTADTTTPTTTHAFPERKTYNVTVTVTDKQGAVSAASAPVAVNVLDGTPPVVSISQPRTKQRINLYKPKTKRRAKVTLFGKASDDTELKAVYLALRPVAVKNGKCKWFDGKSKLIAGDCVDPPVLATKLTGMSWRYSLPLKAKLPKGPYLLAAIAVDASGGYSAFKTVTFRFPLMDDADAYRAESHARWEAVAGGWEAHREAFQQVAEPVSQWLIEAIAPQPGQTIVELAAGVGETGFRAAELVRPGGRVITTDGSEAMVEAARRRAEELGLDNVELRPMDAEWIDLETASADAVLCRWGYMLLADPEAALRETRRVLRPGGRVALAAWDAPDLNPWARSVGAEMVQRGLAPPPDPEAPGMFSFRDRSIVDLLGDTGFTDVVVDSVDVTFRAPSFDEWWEYQFDVSPSLSEGLAAATPQQRDEVYEGVEARLAPYRADDGSYAIPGRALVAAAEA